MAPERQAQRACRAASTCMRLPLLPTGAAALAAPRLVGVLAGRSAVAAAHGGERGGAVQRHKPCTQGWPVRLANQVLAHALAMPALLMQWSWRQQASSAAHLAPLAASHDAGAHTVLLLAA